MAETKTLISFAVTAKLICVFVFAYAKSRFSHDVAHFIFERPYSLVSVQYLIIIHVCQRIYVAFIIVDISSCVYVNIAADQARRVLNVNFWMT